MTTPASGTYSSVGGVPPGDEMSTMLMVPGTAQALDGARKVAEIRGFTLWSDEPVGVGGDGSAPRPLDYLASSILF